jgi:hypothetical protein
MHGLDKHEGQTARQIGTKFEDDKHDLEDPAADKIIISK